MPRFSAFFSLMLAAPLLQAHHSTVAIYDPSRTIDVAGVVEDISWRNPHGRLVLRTADDAVWEAEMPAVVVLRILGIRQDLIDIGDRITIAGSPSRREPTAMAARNILLASGYELAFFGCQRPLFSGRP